MTTNDIADIIIKDLLRRPFPIFLTTYHGHGMDEADVLGINRNGYIYEYEIERSRSDFRAEFKHKEYKHKKLRGRNAIKVYDEWKNGKRTGGKYECILIPNRYFFVCPEGLIKPEEVPEYAGLIYTDKRFLYSNELIKAAPLLHKNKANKRIYERVANILSQRIIFGCSYYTHQQKMKENQS
jgi:hypothetical protein